MHFKLYQYPAQAPRTKTELIRSNTYSGKNHSKQWFFEVFTPYFTKILILTQKRVDFFAKIDLCSKFGYTISKTVESPTKCVSSFPNRDALLQVKKNRLT